MKHKFLLKICFNFTPFDYNLSESATVMNLSDRLLEIAEEKKLIKPKDLVGEKFRPFI
jgi:hypothetical protein